MKKIKSKKTDRLKSTNNLVRGFTLIELLVVIAIIGLLASVVLVSLNGARSKARDTKRRADLHQMSTALEFYYNDNNSSYPSTGGSWRTACSNTTYNTGCNGGGANSCTFSGASGYIPNLAPTYVTQLPKDPRDPVNGCYMYASDGVNYMLMAWGTVENCSNISADPMRRPNYASECDYAVYTSGASTW